MLLWSNSIEEDQKNISDEALLATNPPLEGRNHIVY